VTDELISAAPDSQPTPLHPLASVLADALERDHASQVQVVLDEQQRWLAIEELTSTIAFAEAQGDELRIVPFDGDAEAIRTRPYTLTIGPAWLDETQELVVSLPGAVDPEHEAEVQGLLRAALEYWVRASEQSASQTSGPIVEPALPMSPVPPVYDGPADDVAEVALEPDEEGIGRTADASESTVPAQMRADISEQWSWASSAARIPQISDLMVAVSEPVDRVRISISVRDADAVFGARLAYEGPLPAGTTAVGSVHVPLSARAMSQVEERRGAECVIELEDAGTGKVLARVDESIDLQPRDLWLWNGDPRRAEQHERLIRRYNELGTLLQGDPERPDSDDIRSELEQLKDVIDKDQGRTDVLAQSLLASFVRPNHPEIAVLAREAAAARGRATGEASFHAFQLQDPAEAERAVDASITAIYESLKARSVAYSEPPPGWDYETEGQRIRDHGDVARGGLGTCMDTTVLTAAVIEHVGLNPVLVLIQGHIFIGYWRRDPSNRPDWYPDSPVVSHPAAIAQLVRGGWLGLLETTDITVGKAAAPGQARQDAHGALFGALNDRVQLIDVVAARRAGVSPLPAINERADGVTEIIEYRPGGASKVIEVEQTPLDPESRQRQVDSHPARYRTWKSSLFSLNATNALLNLGHNARVQPIVLPPEGLGVLEDKLNQDRAFSLLSGYDISEVQRARGARLALELEPNELLSALGERKLYLQRIGRGAKGPTALSPSTFFTEIRSMAHNAKTAREERGMNPLFLCLGLLRWPYKPGVFAEAPLVLVPVNVTVARGRQEFTLSLDSSARTTPNAALIEWLRREHGLTIPGLAEPISDRAGIDVDAVLAEVRSAVAERGLPLDIAAEARLATLDLSAFRMWQDLNQHADSFLGRSLVHHLVHTPTQQFEDPEVAATGGSATDEVMQEELEKLETPIPADSTQKRAVVWARQGRTFVLQGPPGTGKSQTITNIVAECVLSGLRVLFVAEKGTALAVVQRRLDAIGLGPFSLNLHHEGSNATEVRAQLKRALTATVMPDSTAMESARRRLRNARFELTQYPKQLHEANAAGLSAYGAHDELLVLQDGPTMPVPAPLVTHHAEQVQSLKDLFQDLQRWTSAARVRPDHPWRLAGTGNGDPFDVETVSSAIRGVLAGVSWCASTSGPLRELLGEVTHPTQLQVFAAAANPALPSGDDLAGVLSAAWPTSAAETVAGCARAVEGWSTRLHGFSPDVLALDLRGIAAQLEAATASGVFGRGKRQIAAIAPLVAVAPSGVAVSANNTAAILRDLIAVQDTAASVRSSLGAVPGLAHAVPSNPFQPGSLTPVRARLDELLAATSGLRDASEWTGRVQSLAQSGHLTGQVDALTAYASTWQRIWDFLGVKEADFQAWRNEETLAVATRRNEETWRRHVDYERLLPLQQWCTLVRKLEPMREARLDEARIELLEGRLPAYVAEDALARGVARASLTERISAAGLDRFDAVAHDQRVTTYSEAQEDVRKQWVTDGPAKLLGRRGGGGVGLRTGGLARELEKTTRKLGTRPILRKYGEAVQELTPLVLCSPSSVVDLIEPGVMEFDVVIFDEASQITVPEAVGALGRARAAVIVGDSKQMPPTRKVGGQQADDEEIDDPDVEEIVEDQESILSECELARVPTLSLNWHYRSQDEALIAFSNRAYYRGDLSSFPTPTLLSDETGVEFRRVDGQYLRAGSGTKVELGNGIVAGNNTNPVEAVAIVQAVHELVHQSGEKLPSIGIVTFNEQQRQLIEDLLLTSADPKVIEVMDETKMGRGEVLFVKALEQVQGDERDIVVFSIAFSKQANGKIPTNFGPLSNSGGERRLNVAVTRARRKNIVFCSFEPGELDVSGSTYNGPKDLKEFLSFARAARSVQEPGDTPHRAALRDRHRDDIAAALRQAGLHVMADVGLSNFRLDLVVARTENPQRPILPILLDGESWRKRSTVSDRDVLPVEVLQNLMGWPTVARIWWPMWLQNRQDVINAILAEVDRAESALNGTPLPEAVAAAIDAESPETVDTQDIAPTSTPAEEVGGAARSVDVVVRPEAESLPPTSSTPWPATEPPAAESPDVKRPVVPAPTPVEHEHAPTPAAPVAPAAQATTEEVTNEPQGGSHAARSYADAIAEFAPAHTNVVGAREVLDALPSRAAAATVREQLLDIIATEGPVELTRLVRIVGRRFGLNAVRAARADDIARLIPRGQLRKGRLGLFAWPAGLDPLTWTGFRIVDPNGSRTLDEIAPEEIANAMQAVVAESPGIGDEDVLRRTAELFGIVRLGAKVRSRLQAVFKKLPAAPVHESEASAPIAHAGQGEGPGHR
jgi:hypothetical protein